MLAEPSEQAREYLGELREARKAHRIGGEELAARIRRAVIEAEELGVTRAEIARLLDIDRSSLYRTYLAVS